VSARPAWRTSSAVSTPGSRNAPPRLLQHVVDHPADLVADQLRARAKPHRCRDSGGGPHPNCAPRTARQQILKAEQLRPKSVVDVVIVVGDVVRDGGDLSLKARPGAEIEREFGVRLGQGPGRLGDRAVMLGEPLQRLPAEIEAGVERIGRLQPRQQPKRVGVVIEAAGARHRLLERVLAGMAEGRMADIVGEAERFGEVLVEAEGAGERSADLGDLEAVGEAHPEMVAVGRDEHLSLVTEAAEGHRMDDPVAIALEGVAGPPRLALRVPVQPPPRGGGIGGEARDRPHLVESFTISCPAGLVQLKAATSSLASSLTNS
jgi:hypothetical protein